MTHYLDRQYTPKSYWLELVAEARYIRSYPPRLLGWFLYYAASCVVSFVFLAVVWAVFAPAWAEPTWSHFWRAGLPLFFVSFCFDMHMCIRVYGHRSTYEETAASNWRNRK